MLAEVAHTFKAHGVSAATQEEHPRQAGPLLGVLPASSPGMGLVQRVQQRSARRSIGTFVVIFLLRARGPCGALNRDGTYCRNNARGVLGGCNQIVAHKWYKARMLARRSTWGRFCRGAFLKFEGRAATFAAMATCLSTLIAAFALLVAALAFL